MKGKLVRLVEDTRQFRVGPKDVRGSRLFTVPSGSMGIVTCAYPGLDSVVEVTWFITDYGYSRISISQLQFVETSKQHNGRPFKEKADAQGR